MMTNRPAGIPSYVTVVRRDETTDGEVCYLAYHPELPNCIGQGSTAAEAEQDLAEATIMTIDYLLESGLPVPEPRQVVSSGSRLRGQNKQVIGAQTGLITPAEEPLLNLTAHV
jgi:predicted RNase H-like HicB family nuclease